MRNSRCALCVAVLPLAGKVDAQPACRLVAAGTGDAKCILQGPETESLWPVARSYHSALAYAQHHGKGEQFQQRPAGEIFHSTISLLNLGEVQDFPARNFVFKATGSSSKTWANTPEGEWTATVDSTLKEKPLTGVLRLGTGGHCSLNGLSVYRPAEGRLTLRLNFDNCHSASGILRAAVAVEVRRAEDGGSGLTKWMCGLMGPDLCKPLGDDVDAVLDLRPELGSTGHPAVWKRLTPVVAGCYQPFVWITLDSDVERSGGGVALSLQTAEWDALEHNLPIVSLEETDADFVVTTDRVCLSVGGRGGSCQPKVQPILIQKSWWKLIIASVIAADISIAITLVAMFRGWPCPKEDNGDLEGQKEPLVKVDKCVIPASGGSVDVPPAACLYTEEHNPSEEHEVLKDSGNPFEVEMQIDEPMESVCKLKPSILDEGLEPEQDGSEYSAESHAHSTEPGRSLQHASTHSSHEDPEQHLLAKVVTSLENGPREVRELVASMSQRHNIVVEGDFKQWLIVRGFTVIPFDKQKAMVSLPLGGMQLRV